MHVYLNQNELNVVYYEGGVVLYLIPFSYFALYFNWNSWKYRAFPSAVYTMLDK